MTKRTTAAVAPVAPVAPKSAPKSAPEVSEVLAEIEVIRAKQGKDLEDCASKVAEKLNKAKKMPCPTSGLSHPARPNFMYWRGQDVEAFVAKHS